ncbi:MAG: hypothetical protein ACJA1W_001804 [Akkermansiaceae bacterium]|jgi:hypothetical protein
MTIEMVAGCQPLKMESLLGWVDSKVIGQRFKVDRWCCHDWDAHKTSRKKKTNCSEAKRFEQLAQIVWSFF